MVVRHLGDTDFKTIMECFLSAFDNYFVKVPTDHNFYKQRWKATGVRFDVSYGMFDNTKLVGFIINAIDNRNGEYIAYNSGTGVIPDYRGQRIVNTIYDYAILDLMKHGITKCVLEVITENVKAIKSYEGIGFEKCKYYRCFGGIISVEDLTNYALREVDFSFVDWDTIPNQELYSWDHQTRSLEKGNYKCF
jgi:ribosomal protein S18 acetylase RimI-like enzyme